jgi:hypothetical protein
MPPDVSATPAGNATLRTLVVVGLTVFVLGLTIPNLWVRASPPPFVTDTHNRVTAVFGSAIGDLRVGDVVDLPDMSPQYRLGLEGGDYYLAPGFSATFPFLRNGHTVMVTFTGPREAVAPFWMTFIKRISAACFVLTAAFLLLSRPSRMLWGFFLFAIGSVNGGPLFFQTLVSLPVYNALVWSLLFIYSTAGIVGLWVFASRFPQDQSAGWRRIADRAAAPAFALLSFVFFFTMWQTWDGIVGWDTTPLSIAGLTIGLLCFVDAYVHLRAEERQRLKWVLFGITVAYVAFGYQAISGELPGGGWPFAWSNAGWTVDVLSGAQIFIPITVAYAVLKHRVIDVNFVISRALVYGVITTLVIGIFALVDWFFSKALAARQIAAVAEIVVALGLGFGLNATHRVVDNIVDRVLFRRRHLAERRLARAAAGVHHVAEPSAIDETLADEPADSLGLASAAVFRRGTNGAFDRTRAVGWGPGTAESISSGDSLVQNLQGERGVIRLRDVRRPGVVMPDGGAAPSLAVPFFTRHELDGFALFGPHLSGEDFDPVEIGLLEHLANAAAAAHDHLRAEEARMEAERLASELIDAKRTIASMRALPAS